MELQKLLKRRNKTLTTFFIEENIKTLEDLKQVCSVLGAELETETVVLFSSLQVKATKLEPQVEEVKSEEPVEEFKEIKTKKKKEVVIVGAD